MSSVDRAAAVRGPASLGRPAALRTQARMLAGAVGFAGSAAVHRHMHVLLGDAAPVGQQMGITLPAVSLLLLMAHRKSMANDLTGVPVAAALAAGATYGGFVGSFSGSEQSRSLALTSLPAEVTLLCSINTVRRLGQASSWLPRTSFGIHDIKLGFAAIRLAASLVLLALHSQASIDNSLGLLQVKVGRHKVPKLELTCTLVCAATLAAMLAEMFFFASRKESKQCGNNTAVFIVVGLIFGLSVHQAAGSLAK